MKTILSIAAMLILALGSIRLADAQTYSVIYSFTGGQDGANPQAGVTLDQVGNLYGTAARGGSLAGNCSTLGAFGGTNTYGCGTVFELKRENSGWLFNPLYTFHFNDGALPLARVVFGPDGLLYGTTSLGGTTNLGETTGPEYAGNCETLNWLGCGVIFSLQPPATFCRSVLCPWSETLLYEFGTGAGNGKWPNRGDVIFDPSGNAYVANILGDYEFSPSDGWTVTDLYNLVWIWQFYFQTPSGSVIMDPAGNLYGTAQSGPYGAGGGAYELTPSYPQWNFTYLFVNNLGGSTEGSLVRDSAGNLYGTTDGGGDNGGGIVYEVSPSNGGWTSSVLYNFSGNFGSYAVMVMDAAGNLYGTTVGDGAYGEGNVFELSPSNGGWTYTSLYDFTGGSDGGAPYGQVTLDASGNLYGTATIGGANNAGVVWEITP